MRQNRETKRWSPGANAHADPEEWSYSDVGPESPRPPTSPPPPPPPPTPQVSGLKLKVHITIAIITEPLTPYRKNHAQLCRRRPQTLGKTRTRHIQVSKPRTHCTSQRACTQDCGRSTTWTQRHRSRRTIFRARRIRLGFWGVHTVD